MRVRFRRSTGKWTTPRLYYSAEADELNLQYSQSDQFDQEQPALRATGRCRAVDCAGILGAVKLIVAVSRQEMFIGAQLELQVDFMIPRHLSPPDRREFDLILCDMMPWAGICPGSICKCRVGVIAAHASRQGSRRRTSEPNVHVKAIVKSVLCRARRRQASRYLR